MTFQCPDCGAEHRISGMLSQADHVARLKAKSGEIERLRALLAEVTLERDNLLAEARRSTEAA